MASSEAMTSSTHSFAYSYGLVKKCFLKICETSQFHNFLIFQPIFIRFSLFCSEYFTLSSEIKLDQLRTSPLKVLLKDGDVILGVNFPVNHTIVSKQTHLGLDVCSYVVDVQQEQGFCSVNHTVSSYFGVIW